MEKLKDKKFAFRVSERNLNQIRIKAKRAKMTVTSASSPPTTIPTTSPGEYRAAMRGESWKFRLIKAIDEALEHSPDKESFILNMEYEGYEVRWTDTRKHILFTTPEGRKCRDDSLHDETYLKETLEKLFAYRAAHGYEPRTPEPPEGWLGQANSIGKLASDAVRLGKSVEKMADVPPPLTPFTPTDSKQKRREALKKLAQGHKLQSEQEQEFGQEM